MLNSTDSNNKPTTIVIPNQHQEPLKKEVDQQRIPAILVTYSYEEAEMLGAFEEQALSEADALEAIEESHL